jgi:hypothetical protein
VEDLANDQVQVGLVAEGHDFLGLHFRQFAKQFRRRAGSFESVGAYDLARGEADYFTEDFGGLHCAQPRAGEDGIGLNSKCAQSESGGVRLLHAFGRKGAFRVRRAVGIFAVYRDAMAYKV